MHNLQKRTWTPETFFLGSVSFGCCLSHDHRGHEDYLASLSFSSEKNPLISSVIFEKVLEGANNQETTTPKLGLCHGIFSDQAIF